MDLKFSKQIENNGGNKAEILLFDNIGSGSNTGQQIAQEVSWLVDVAQVEEILVRISSGGGSMIEGFGIFSALQDAKDKGITVNVKIEGLAASMAGIIAMIGDEISMVDYGILMMHNPHTGGGSVDEGTQKILDKFKASAIKIITNRTGKDSEEISSLMDQETWLDASEALEQGFIDKVIESATPAKKEEAANKILDIAMSFAHKELTTNKNKMKKVLAHFNLEESATEQEILDKVTLLEEQLIAATENEHNANVLKEEIENSFKDLETKNEDLSAKVIEANSELVNVLIDNAIDAGKIKRDAKSKLIEAASGNTDLVKTMINSVETPKVKLSDLIDNKSEETKMSFRELEKNDPAKLEAIKNSNIEEFKRLYKAEYGAEYKG